jgi:hypothetical protein
MYGICIRCECCAATLGGEQVTRNPEVPLRATQGQELRRRAAELGWSSDHQADKDWCPVHLDQAKDNGL